MVKHISRNQIGVIYAAMKRGSLTYNKEVINMLYSEVADHDLDLEDEREYAIFRTVKGVVDSICDPDGYWISDDCDKFLAELVSTGGARV